MLHRRLERRFSAEDPWSLRINWLTSQNRYDPRARSFLLGSLGRGELQLINALAVQKHDSSRRWLELINLLEGQPAAGFGFIRKLLAIILNRIVAMTAT
jgi:hypothetical protein